MTTLFVNACMRGEDSRTLSLCRDYLETVKDEVIEVNLAESDLKPFNAQNGGRTLCQTKSRCRG